MIRNRIAKAVLVFYSKFSAYKAFSSFCRRDKCQRAQPFILVYTLIDNLRFLWYNELAKRYFCYNILEEYKYGKHF